MPYRYDTAAAELTGRCKNRRKVGNNTYLERLGDDIGLLYHETHIIVWRPNGDIVLDSGGWRTYTTKERMTNYLPGTYPQHAWVRQERGIWYVKWHDTEYGYSDGMILHADGAVTGGKPVDEIKADRREADRQARRIRKFVDGITADDIVRAWEAGTRSDCLYCQLTPMPEYSDHLDLHVDENYFHASLAYQAIKARGYPNPDVIMAMIYSDAQRGRVSRDLTDNLARFLRANLTSQEIVTA